MTKLKHSQGMAKSYNERSVIIGALRRAFARHPHKLAVLRAGRREITLFNQDGSISKRKGVEHHCQVCNEWKRGGFDVDHINPVIDPNDTTLPDWNTVVARIFCPPENLQRICPECHDAKTAAENRARWVRRWSAELDSIDTIADPQVRKKILKRLSKCKAPEIAERAKRMLQSPV